MTCRSELVKKLVPSLAARCPKPVSSRAGRIRLRIPTDLEEFDLDAVCIGEGEEPLRRCVEAPDDSHPGIWLSGWRSAEQKWWAKTWTAFRIGIALCSAT